jgi:acetyl-CoA carboxylase biotin carboxyl carrier protein
MEFGLNEILTMIDKVKSTELALFEYQDADTKIKIRGAKTGRSGRSARSSRRNVGMEMCQDAYGSLENETMGTPEDAYRNLRTGTMRAAEEVYGNSGSCAAGAAAEYAVAQQGNSFQNGSPVVSMQESPVPVVPEASGKPVVSPMVGTFYAAPSEGEEPFVKVGDTVKKGQTIGIVEAMKLMNEIESEYDGVVEEVFVANEQMVEYGQPLIRVREG